MATPVVTMRQLLESGVHFGHQTRRWNPKMKRFIFTERNGIYIIDLQQSLAFIDRAYDFVKETVAHGGTIMFIGTKKQAQEVDRRAGRARRHALRQPALAGRHAHQLLDRPQAPAAPEGARGARLRGRRGAPASRRRSCCSAVVRRTSWSAPSAASATWPACPSAVWIVDTKKEHIGDHRGQEARHPGRRDPRHQLRPRRGRLPDPGQRRRDPRRQPADPGDRRRRRRGSHGPRRRLARWRRQAGRCGRRRAAGRVGARAARGHPRRRGRCRGSG